MPDKRQLAQLYGQVVKGLLGTKKLTAEQLMDSGMVHGLPFLMEHASRPVRGESVAITFSKPKTAALCYDRVWDPTGQIVPESIRFSFCTPAECKILAFLLLERFSGDRQGMFRLISDTGPKIPITITTIPGGKESVLYHTPLQLLVQDICGFARCRATPIYGSAHQQQEEYKPGDHQAIVMALENLNIVDESQLTWDQIRQFREDTESRSKYRRLIHWLDKDMVGKSQSFVEDEIAVKLENYEHALEKHGIKSVVGAFKDLLYDNLGLFGAAGLAAAGFPYLAGGIVVGKVGVKLAEAHLDLDDVKHGDNSEIAAVYEIKQLDAGPDA